jgi:murein tripeptide amidase MpaA
MTLQIDADFDCGNIEVLDIADDGADLAIRADSKGPWFQWFYFRVRGGAGRALTLRIVNAAASAYPQGWPGYRARVSDDDENWRRADTRYENGILEIQHRPERDDIWFAYFAPYDLARLGRFIARASASSDVAVKQLGHSVDGRPMTCLTLGQGPRQVWLIGRQHSGETMASWWMEGALDRLLDGSDAAAARLRQVATIHLAPLVNLDGAARGNLRGNAAGIDLNRQWHEPDPATAPEVAAVLAAMDETGVDLSLDVHGDETLPHVFVDGCDHDPAATPAQVAGVAIFKAALAKASPAFQTIVGYDATYGGEGAPGMATRAIARRFGAVGLTLEMPFNDSLEAKDPVHGWSPAASARLGRESVEAILAAIASL